MKNFFSAVYPLTWLLVIFFCTNCNNDPEPQAGLQLVSSTNQNYVSENRTIAGGTPVITGVYAQAASDKASLTKFTVTFNHDSTDRRPPVVYLDSTLAPGTKNFAMQLAYTTRNLANKEIWKFIVTDSDGKTYQRVVRLKTTTAVNVANSTFYTYSTVLLSRVKNPRNNLDSIGFVGFAAVDGTAFPAYAAKQPSMAARTDFTLNNAATAKPNLSPISGDSLHLTDLTSAQFDAINRVNDLKAAFPATAAPVTSVGSLRVEQVLAYKNIANKVSLLRIKRVYKTLDSLEFDVKAEK